MRRRRGRSRNLVNGIGISEILRTAEQNATLPLGRSACRPGPPCYFDVHALGESFPGPAAVRAPYTGMRRRDLRSERGFDQTEAASRALPAGLRTASFGGVRRGGHFADADDGRPVPRKDVRFGGEIPGGLAVR